MRAETAALIMMSGKGKPDLEDITITENGEYESVDHDGFDVVTVEVETYWDEYQQALADLEDCHDCWEEVVAALQVYDPDYDPDEGECPADEVPVVYQIAYDEGAASVTPALGSKFITANGTYYASSDSLDGYDTVVVDVQTWESCIHQIAAKLGLTDPYDCNDIKEAIDEQTGYEFPEGTEYSDIAELVKGDPLVDESVDAYPMSIIGYDAYQGSWYMSSGYVSNGEFVALIGWQFGIDSSVEKPTVLYSKVLDPATGYCEFKAQYLYGGSYRTQTLHATAQALIGYGESGHTYKVKNS